jgi:hypothetical protein
VATRDGHVELLVLLVIAGQGILEAFLAQALLQLGGGREIHLVAADALLGWIAFACEEEKRRNTINNMIREQSSIAKKESTSKNPSSEI